MQLQGRKGWSQEEGVTSRKDDPAWEGEQSARGEKYRFKTEDAASEAAVCSPGERRVMPCREKDAPSKEEDTASGKRGQ